MALSSEPGMSKLGLIVHDCMEWAKGFNLQNKNPNLLSEDEILALALYTWDLGLNGKREENFYFNLNHTLQERNPEKMQTWAGYLYFLQSALSKFPDMKAIVYRGIPSIGITKHYNDSGALIHWSGYSSSSTSLEKAQAFAGKGGVVMKISVNRGKKISFYSTNPSEDEVLLSPNMNLLVRKGLYDYNGQAMVDLAQYIFVF